MLVLNRRNGEFVQVRMPDGRVGRITVQVKQGKASAKLVLDFPSDCEILREEIIAGGEVSTPKELETRRVG